MRAWTSLTLVLGLSCAVNDRATSIEGDVPYACRSDRDCSVGRCVSDFGICARDSGDVMTVLFEVTPSASDPIYGGARYMVERNLTNADLEYEDEDGDGYDDRGIKAGWLELNLPPRVPVSGSIRVDPGTGCVSRLARSTLRATLFFTPRQRLLGLGVPTYELSTEFDEDLEEYVFQGLLPPGNYDVYMRPLTERLPADCKAIPQIFRNQPIGSCNEPKGCVQQRFELQPVSYTHLTLPTKRIV